MLRQSWLIVLYIKNQWFHYSSKISGGLWNFPGEVDYLGAARGALQNFEPPLDFELFQIQVIYGRANEVFFQGGGRTFGFPGGDVPPIPPISRHAE